MIRKFIFFAVIVIMAGAGILILSRAFQHAEPVHPALIGILVRGQSYAPGVDGFKKRMNDLGYKEGETVTYLVRFVDKKEEIAPAVSEFLKSGVTLFYTLSTPVTAEVYKQTKIIPVVFGSVGDPLATEFVESLDRPGKNVTGISSLSVALVPKRLEFLLEAVPSIKTVAYPFTAEDIPAAKSYPIILDAAAKLGVKIIPYYITKDRDVRATALAIRHTNVDGIVLAADSATWANLDAYVAQAKKEKLPFAVFDKDMVTKGGLIGYGPDYFVSGEQSAVLADKILHGRKPTDLPIETPGKFILAVNLDTADAIGLHLPSTLLQKADLIIQTK